MSASQTATAVNMDDFDPEVFVKHKSVVLVVATYGEGDPTDNAQNFFSWLKDESHVPGILNGMSYTIMGLGNSQYKYFNQCAKDADEHMERLGATRIYERCEGDDDDDIQQDWDNWKEGGLWTELQKSLGVLRRAAAGGRRRSLAEVFGDLQKCFERRASCDSRQGSKENSRSMKLPLVAEVHDDQLNLPADELVQDGGADVLGKWYFGASLVPVSACDELRQFSDPATGKTAKHIDLDVSKHPDLAWSTADNLEVLPRNPPDVVEWFASYLGVSELLDSYVTFARAPGIEKAVKKPFPAPCTVRTALEMYCDLSFAPPMASIKRLAAFATEEDKERLEALLREREVLRWLTGEGVRISFQEFVQLFMPTWEADLGTFLQVCPRQKSRPYTIASSSLEDRNTIGICVGMLQEQLVSLAEVVEGLESRGHGSPHAYPLLQRAGAEAAALPRTFRGSCSTLLCTGVDVKSEVLVHARASTFRLPVQTDKPIIMVGAGTGIAPFRAFVREFRAEAELAEASGDSAKARAKTYLYFGCTKRDVDFLYKDELNEALALETPALTDLISAFSREQQQKVYVQHRVRERASEVAQLVREGAHIYVCGAVSMGRSIREEVASALGTDGPELVEQLAAEGRFVEELW